MTTKFVALNLLLVAALGVVGWQAKTHWDEAQARRRASLGAKIAPAVAPAVAPAPKPEEPAAAKYVDVAQKNLFAKDRNPNVIIDPPAVTEKPKPMPPLPVLYGVMGLPSGMRALMAEKSGAGTKPVQAGDRIGEFKILSLDAQNIVLEWDGKPISRKVDELIDRTSARDAGGAGPVAAAPVVTNLSTPAAQQAPGQQQNAAAPPPGVNQASAGKPGAEVGAPGHSERGCLQGDSSPAGTVVDGYRKTVSAGLFGTVCRWVPAQ